MRLDNAIQSAVAGQQLGPTVTKFRKAANQMEQVFLKQLFTQLRQMEGMGEKKSYGMEMYQDMMDDAMAQAVAQRGDFGIASQLRRNVEPMLFRQAFASIKLEIAAAKAEESKTKQDLKV